MTGPGWDLEDGGREALMERFAAVGYIGDPQLAMAILLMRRLQRPLLLEGEAGVGKTEVAKALAQVLERPLIRLQCYEGLDAHAAVYEWNYQRQLLAIKLWEGEARSVEEKEQHIFRDEFLLRRPLLQAISMETAPVLLVDEIDRADEEFEAYLLEVLSDYQVSIPELGTVTAKSVPFVVLTSNDTRELSDALRRRCLYHYMDFPSEDKELRIVMARVPGIELALASEIVRFVQAIRREDIQRKPGVAETLDWAGALLGLGLRDLREDPETLYDSLICLLKTNEDRQAIAPVTVERLAAKAG
ncbi:MAG: MoxR family ATPase [Kiloniellales bacterium]|nr:MoxR family ATPase [Kiloniellales bacterium]